MTRYLFLLLIFSFYQPVFSSEDNISHLKSLIMKQQSQLIPLVKIAPRCPSDAAMAEINGSVVLELLVNESGRVDTIKVKQAKPSKIFNKEALKAVRRWQFKPKSVDGVAVPQLGLLTVEFVCNV